MLGDINRKGIISEAVESIFNKINERNREKFCLRASYLEMCCESITDLLDSDKKKIKVSGDADYRLQIQNVNKQEIHSSNIVLDLITLGTRRRTFEKNSHTVLNISLTQQRGASVRGVAESHLNFLFLSGCVDQGGAFGDYLKKGCSHFPITNIVDLIDETNRNNVKTQDRVLKVVLKHFLGGIRVVCTISSHSQEDCFSFLRLFSAVAETENELTEIQEVPVGDSPSQIDGTCQDEPEGATDKEPSETSGMYRRTPSYTRNGSFLETIKEEEEEMEKSSISSDMTSTSGKIGNHEGDELHMENGGDDNSYMIDDSDPPNNSNSVYASPSLERCPHASNTQDFISYYQRKYDELQEFTSNEKKIYEESFNIQLAEANSRIEELEEINRGLEKQLSGAMGDGNALIQNGVNDRRADRIAMQRELNFLKRELEKSERKRNEYEVKLELLQTNFQNRNRELVESLEEAYKELSGFVDIQQSTNSIEEASSERNEMKSISNNITCLKNEIYFLKNENARYANLSQKIEEYFRIKKCLVREGSLSTKITDLEAEVSSLKKMNSKLTEDLNKKEVELKEINATYSLCIDEKILIKGDKEKVSKHLEQILEENKKQCCAIDDLKALSSVNSDKIESLSKNLEDKDAEIETLRSENSDLSENLNYLNKMSSKLSRKIEEKEADIQSLILENSQLKNELARLESKNEELSTVCAENKSEIGKLMSENALQQEKINSMITNENSISNMREEMSKLSGKLTNSETKIKTLSHLDIENAELRDKISDLQYKVKTLLVNSEDKVIRIQELVSENTILKDQIISYIKEIEHVTGRLEEQENKVKEYIHENCRLKESVCLLKQNTLKISESLDEKNIEIKDLTSDNFMLNEEIKSLKNCSKKIALEASLKIKQLEFENLSLKENIHTLTSNLEAKDADLMTLTAKQDEEKQAMDTLRTEVAILKKEISLLHKENGSLSNMVNQNGTKYNGVLPKEAIKDFPDYETVEKQNEDLSDACKLNVDRTKLYSPCLALTANDRSQLSWSSIGKDIALEEEERTNRLRRKVFQQRKMLNKAQRREIQMRTNVDMCMSQMNCIQNLREGYAVQNHRIQQLEFQAQRDEYVYKSRIDCLEAFINNLRSENVVLKAQLQQVNCKLKNLFVGIKKMRKHNSSLTEVAIQTIPSTDSSVYDIKTLKLDSSFIKENNTKRLARDFGSQYESKPAARDCGSQCESSTLPSTASRDGTPVAEPPFYSVLKIKTKKSVDITLKKKVQATIPSEKNISKNYTKSPHRHFIPGQYTGFHYPQDCNVLGAEGWARLGREFDEQNRSST